METVAADTKHKLANRWWLDRHTNDPSPKRSLWLHSTLSDLDETTMAMLKIIDEDADSFAKRAEMYYKKRPELIGMVEDMYRSHRSLAVRFDQLKTETGSRLIAPLSSPFRFNRPEKLSSNLSSTMTTFSDNKSYDSYSETYDHPDESAESEIDDPEEEEAEEETASVGEMAAGMKLREEMNRVEEEKKGMKDELKQKDEEKREVIRQLSMALDMVKEENLKLRKKLAEIHKDSSSNPNPNPNKGKGKGKGKGIISPVVELKRLKDTFFGKLFFNGFPRTQVKVPL